MTYEIFFKSSATERYDTDQNDRVRTYLETAGFHDFGEFGGTALGLPVDDPTASDNGFVVETDEVTARRLGNGIAELLGNRDVYVQPGGTDG
jgi:hypothetical protein